MANYNSFDSLDSDDFQIEKKDKKYESIDAIAKNIKENDFKKLCNTKVIKRLEIEFKSKYHGLSMPQKQLICYSYYQGNLEKQKLVQLVLCSFGITGAFIISRIPNIHRFIRLGLYGFLGLSVYKIQNYSTQYFIQSNFQNVSLKILEAKELKQMYRAYQIKKAEADEDKKALAKYKYDPQSYH